MSTSTLDFGGRKKTRRLEYSKNGCRECKRRKIKCDEQKPSCWQCSRLHKPCSYPQVGEKVARVSRKKMHSESPREVSVSSNRSDPLERPHMPPYPMYRSVGGPAGPVVPGAHPHAGPHPHGLPHGPSPAAHSPAPPLTPSTGPSPPGYELPKLVLSPGNVYHMPALVPKHPQSSISNLLNDIKSPMPKVVSKGTPENLSSAPGPSMFNTPQSFSSGIMASKQDFNNDMMMLGPETYQFNQDDLNLLASDLSNIVTDIMFESNFETKYRNHANDAPSTLPSSSLKSFDAIPKDVPFDYIKVTKSQERIYLEEFYNEFANVILPFQSYDESRKCYFNPARDILLHCASQESFLLAAILAQGAKSSFNKNNLPEDEEAYCLYLSESLKLLGPALGGNTARETNSLTSNIEAVLLTVLLLTSSNASNTKQNWRPHLRGAKDLLLKNTSNKTQFRNSKVLVFCKFWYVSIEVLAGLSSNLGGTLKSDEEIDMLITSGDDHEIKVLKELGFILEKGFNLIGGYHYKCVLLLRDVIKHLNKMRNSKDYVPSDTYDYIRLISEFYNQGNIEFINRKSILDPEDFENGVVPQGHLLDVTTVQNKKIVISWMDLSQQAYILASLITILTKCFQLPYDSPHVQHLTSRLINLLAFLGKASETPRLIKCSIMMIQWPMLVAGMNCIEESYKFLIMKFFRSAAHIGSGSAGFALRKIHKTWSKKNRKESDSDEESAIDIVSY